MIAYLPKKCQETKGFQRCLVFQSFGGLIQSVTAAKSFDNIHERIRSRCRRVQVEIKEPGDVLYAAHDEKFCHHRGVSPPQDERGDISGNGVGIGEDR